MHPTILRHRTRVGSDEAAIGLDDRAVRIYVSNLPAEKIIRRGGIERTGAVNQQIVEILKPKKHDVPHRLQAKAGEGSSDETIEKILNGPRHRHRGAADRTARHLIKVPEEPPHAEVREAGEIVPATVNLLHERRFCIDEA